MKVGTILKANTIYVSPIKDSHLIMANCNENLCDFTIESFKKENDSGMRIPTIEELQVIKDNYEVLKNFRLRADTYVSSSRDHNGNSWLLGIGNCGIQTHSVSLRLVKTVNQMNEYKLLS